MELLLKQIKNDSNKYADNGSVLQKLIEKGYIQQLASLLEQIFRDEQQYTIQELNRIMKNVSKDKYFDLDMQFKLNTTIFKANFDVIIGIVANNIWNKITEEISKQNIDDYKQDGNKKLDLLNSYSDNQLINEKQDRNLVQSEIIQADDISQALKISQSEKKVNKKQQEKNQKKQVHNKNPSLQQIEQEKRDDQANSPGWVRKNLKRNTLQQTSNSQMEVNKTDLYAGRNSQIINKNQSFSILTLKKQSDKKLQNNISSISVSSIKSFRSAGKIPQAQTELSEIRNSACSFTKAQRQEKTQFEQSPGPQQYNPDKSLVITKASSPSTRFSKSPRTSWIDEKLRYDTSCISPGPKYNPSKKYSSKKPKK